MLNAIENDIQIRNTIIKIIYTNLMTMKKEYLFFYLFFFFFVACDNEKIEKTPVVENRYDPSLPVSFDGIKPTYGGIDKPFVVEGNFPGDITDMKVYFGGREAVIISTDGKVISGIIPKQPDGYNPVTVVAGKDSLASGITFKYQQTRAVKTVAGLLGANAVVDGDINAARIEEATGIATVKGQNGDNIVVVESWWMGRLRFISLDDNTVITLNTGVSFSTPAVNSSREVFYVVGMWGDQHNIYKFSREEGWAPRMTGIKISQDDLPGHVWSCQFADDDRYLYVLDAQGNIACVDLEDESYVKLSLEGTLPTRFADRSHLAYSKFHNCFFASFPDESGVYKIFNDNDKWKCERYAGFNGAGSTTGHRLNDAQFIQPYGLTVNDEGEIYMVSRGGHYVCKISGDQVELVAGRPGTYGTLNGDPLDSRFDQPQDITVDSDGNFYIAGGLDRTVRKLTIE